MFSGESEAGAAGQGRKNAPRLSRSKRPASPLPHRGERFRLPCRGSLVFGSPAWGLPEVPVGPLRIGPGRPMILVEIGRLAQLRAAHRSNEGRKAIPPTAGQMGVFQHPAPPPTRLRRRQWCSAGRFRPVASRGGCAEPQWAHPIRSRSSSPFRAGSAQDL
jgi:hypothetical protein